MSLAFGSQEQQSYFFSFFDYDVDNEYVKATFGYTHFIAAQLKLSAWLSRS